VAPATAQEPAPKAAAVDDAADEDAPKAPVARVEPVRPQREISAEAKARREFLKEQARQRAEARARNLNDPRRQRPAPATTPPSQ
jgi:hypothetical protein